jgi:hypothetical protein
LYFFEELKKVGTNKLPEAIGTIKLPERQIYGSSDKPLPATFVLNGGGVA